MKKRLITVGIASFALSGGLLTAAPAMAAETTAAQSTGVATVQYDHHSDHGDHGRDHGDHGRDHHFRHHHFRHHHHFKHFRHHHFRHHHFGHHGWWDNSWWG